MSERYGARILHAEDGQCHARCGGDALSVVLWLISIMLLWNVQVRLLGVGSM